MNTFFRLTFLSFVGLVVMSMSTGCASKTQKQINSLQAQIGVLTDEVVRLDEAVQDSRGATVVSSSTPSSVSAPSGATVAVGTVYRTPSGFELPALSIQQALKNAGYYQGSLDGKIGSGTKAAVKAFQRDHDLTADGVVGRSTWNKLKVYLHGTAK